jgi:bifunctional DNA-binding transcriptional regulator/antitoxin component of YhaV-PrlF toxin-antitoxin module
VFLELEVRGDDIILRLLDPVKRSRCRRLREEAEKKAREMEERLGIRRRREYEYEEDYLIPWWERPLPGEEDRKRGT